MIASVMAGLVIWPAVPELAAIWTKSEAYRYVWLVFPLLVYLLGWHRRDEIFTCQAQPDAAGIGLAVVAAVAWSAAAAANIDIGRQFAAILVIQAIALSTLGRQLYWRVLPIMGLLFLTLPSADFLLSPLRKMTLKAIELFASIAQLPLRIDGFSVHIGERSYVVLDACAGLSHLTLTFFLGYCCGLLLFRSIFRIAALALLAACLGVLSNALRVNAIVWLDWVQGSRMDLAAHARIQWIALLFVLALLFYVVTRLKAEAPDRHAGIASAAPPSAIGRHAPVVAGLAVLTITGSVSLLLNEDARVARARSVALLPAAILGWELASPSAQWSAGRRLESLSLSYRRNGQNLLITVVEARSPGAKLLESSLAPLDQQDWRDTRSETLSSCAASRCLRFKHTLWQRELQPAVRHVYHNYTLGDFQTDSKLGLRTANAWFRLVGKRGNPRLIGFAVDGDALALGELAAIQLAIEAALANEGQPVSI